MPLAVDVCVPRGLQITSNWAKSSDIREARTAARSDLTSDSGPLNTAVAPPFPWDGETCVACQFLCGQLDRIAVAENGLHDVGSKEAEPRNPGEVYADARLESKLRHHLTPVAHHHLVEPVRLSEEPQQAVVRLPLKA